MVISVADALNRRVENYDIEPLIEAIDDFLASPQAEDTGLDFDTEIPAPVRRHLDKLYSDAGWDIRWDEEGNLWMKPHEDSDRE